MIETRKDFEYNCHLCEKFWAFDSSASNMGDAKNSLVHQATSCWMAVKLMELFLGDYDAVADVKSWCGLGLHLTGDSSVKKITETIPKLSANNLKISIYAKCFMW